MSKLWLRKEVPRHLRSSDCAASEVRVARRPRIDREGELSPGIGRSLITRTVGIEKPAAGERAHLGPAEAFKKRDATVEMGVSSGFGADQYQL
jgi:hypothetical protein